MKKRNITQWAQWALLAACTLSAFGLSAQTNVNMPLNNGPQTFTLTAGTFFNFYDNGGAAGNYASGSGANSVATFVPSAPATRAIRVSFTSFSTENGWDAMYIFNSALADVNPLPGPNGATIGGFPGGNWQGTTSPGTITAGSGIAAVGCNPTNALTFRFLSDASVALAGWSAVIDEVLLGAACALATPANLTVSTGAATCEASPSLATPVQNPAGCVTANGNFLRYRVNGGAPVGVATPIPANVTVGPLPRGVHVIQWEVVNAAGSILTCTSQSVTVVDLTPPTITCPANVTLNLPPGDCKAIYSYNVSFSDNCPATLTGFFAIPDTTIALSANSLSCNPGAIINNYFQVLTGFGSNYVTQFVRVGIVSSWPGGSSAAATLTARLYTLTNTAQPYNVSSTNRTLIATSAPFSVPAGSANQKRNIPIAANIPAGSTILMEVESSHPFVVATPAGTGARTWIASTPCGLPPTAPSTFISLGFALDMWAGLYASAPIVGGQISGLPSGAEFPIGTTTNVWKVTDASGNMSTCSFSVTVKEYPNAIKTLICNDLVYFSVDENCQGTVLADQVLEGGPYGCYDNYIVELDKTAPFGNGPWVPAVVGPSDVGKTYQVRVIDPKTGNKCWGDLKVEDKLAPKLDCPPAFAVCNGSLVPGVSTGTIFGAAKTLPTSSQTINNGFNGVMFDLRNDGATAIQITGFDAPVPAGAHGVEVYVTTTATTAVGNQANAGAWTKLATLNVTGNGAFPNYAPLAKFSLPTAYTMPAGQRKGFYISVTDGSTFGYANNDLTTTDGTLSIISAGHSAGQYPFVNANSPRAFIGSVSYKAVLPPLGFPNGLVLNTNVFAAGDKCYTVTGGTGTPVLEPCSNASLCYVDASVDQACATGLTKIVNRKWTATDASGNTKTCIQKISVLRGALSDVLFPTDYDDVNAPAFICAGAYPTPQWIESQPGNLQGYPWLFGKNDGCSINWTFTDTRITVCTGTYKIRRVWSIIDWCSGTSSEYVQLIKVIDKAGPAIACPANLTATTDPYTCCGSIDLPDVIVEDLCSNIASISAMVIVLGDPATGNQGDTLAMHQVGGSLTTFPGNNLWDRDTLARYGTTPCLPIGRHTVVYTATDDCGNSSTCSFRLDIRDYTPPAPACDEFTTIAMGVDDPYDCYLPSAGGCEFAGVTWVKAKTFDDGSYDNCGGVKFTIQRMGPDYSDCILGLNAQDGSLGICNDQDGIISGAVSEFERAITEYDSIKFYCCEVGTQQTVILRIYQTDASGNVTVGPDGTPVFNSCMIQVDVQDKVRPVCQSPANVTVSCENFDPSLWAYGKPSIYDNCCLDTALVYQGQCGLTHSANYSQFDTLCNRGTITRTFRAFDCHGNSQQCTQRIIVTYEQDYFVRFPDDRIVTVCDGTGTFGEPTFLNKDCELLGVSFTDEVFTVVPDACYKIERTWHIINWCFYNANLGLTVVPNPNPNATVNHPSNNTGPVVSSSSNPNVIPAPWTASRIALTPGAALFDYSTLWSLTTNGYSYKQIIKVVDQQKPTVSNCPASPVTFCDLTPNAADLWNESYWWDNTTMSHDLCEGPTDLTITATDACSGANITIKYLLFLDLDNNGTMETVLSSSNLPGFNTVNYNNALNPNFTGGIPYAFDERSVPSNQKYGFALQTTTSGSSKTAAVRWNTAQSPNVYSVPELPYGTHKIKWVVEDGCGNEAVCEYTFIVKDCKKPTVVCLNGLSVNIMPTGMIALWASDFLQYTEDNCTPAAKLKIAIRKAGKPDGQGNTTGFPRNADGTPQTSVTFTCTELGQQDVELWSIDLAGNADYCGTYVLVQDNSGNCGTNAAVAGVLSTEGKAGLEDATIEVVGAGLNSPSFTKTALTNEQGAYSIPKGVPFGSNSTVTPTNDNNPLNGVSTYDLVLISKHILGLEPLGSAYKMIAADANKSGSITTFDVVELRKLILGIYTELPSSPSWRFADKKFNFPDPSNPFKTSFPENTTLADVQINHIDESFVAMKVGDVNNSAVANALMAGEDRTAGTLLFDVEDRAVKAGETFEVSFKASERSQGYQMTLGLSGLSVSDIVKSDRVSADNFGVFADALTVSVDGSSEFTVRFRASKAGKLSEMLSVSSRVTRAEAYDLSGGRQEVALRFNGQGGSTISGVGFELYQNQPNPFVSKTFIGFHLPEAASATLTVLDESGRTLFTQKGDYAKGYNAVSLDRTLLGTSGVLYYKLETATASATKKMIQSK